MPWDDWESSCSNLGWSGAPHIDSWVVQTPPRVITVLLTAGDIDVVQQAGPLHVDVTAVGSNLAGPTLTGDHLILDYTGGTGGFIDLVVPPEVERIELAICAGDATVQQISSELYAEVKIGFVTGTELTSPDVEVDNQVGDTNLDFALAPTDVSVHGTQGDIDIAVPSETCDCDLTISGQGNVTLTGVAQDISAALSITASRTFGVIAVRGR